MQTEKRKSDNNRVHDTPKKARIKNRIFKKRILQPPTSIQKINSDCLIKILSNLPFSDRLQAEHVCKKWRFVCRYAWNNTLNFDNSDYDLMKKNFGTYWPKQCDIEEVLGRCGPCLATLTLRGDLDSDILMVVEDYCCNLEQLEVDLIEYSNKKYFDEILVNMNKLKSLRIYFDGDLNFNTIKIPHSVEEIVIKSRSRISDISGKDFAWGLVYAKGIRSITLHNCSINSFTMTIIKQIIPLTHLEFSSCHFDSTIDFSNLINLKHFHMSCCLHNRTEIYDPSTISLNPEKLKRLVLIECTLQSDEIFKNLDCYDGVEEVVLHNLHPTNDSNIIIKLLEKFSNLTVLECPNIWDLIHNKNHEDIVINILQKSPCIKLLDIRKANIGLLALKYASDIAVYRQTKLLLLIDGIYKNNFGDLRDISHYLHVEFIKSYAFEKRGDPIRNWCKYAALRS